MGRAHISDVHDMDAPCDGEASSTRTNDQVSSASWIGRLPPNAKIAAFVVLLGTGSGAGGGMLGGLFDGQLRRDVDANAAAIESLGARLDRCDAQVAAVQEDSKEIQFWIASSMPVIANGLHLVGKAVGAEVKVELPQLPGRGRR